MGLFRIRGRKKRDKAAEYLEQPPVIATAEPEVARREVSVEERPDPDQPGWGRAIGQAIGKAREERSSHG
jgi:hypothetical protein